MAKREKIAPKQNYFVDDKSELSFISSGCTVLDCALGGGWCLGRTVNIVGDRSTAKTALGTEALINFKLQFPKGKACYRDIEGAFDERYAEAMGLPLDEVDFGDGKLDTVEQFAADFEPFLDQQIKNDEPGIYIVDSWDALSDAAEMDRAVGEATYGMGKAKMSSELFRKFTRKIERSKVLLIIISQVRDNIGAMFGEKHKRSGGRALDFYSSQILWLSHIKTLKKTINKVERPYGVTIRSKVKKNKVGLPFRECDWDFVFGFGIDDLVAGVEWLKEVGKLGTMNLKDVEFKNYIKEIVNLSDAEYAEERKNVAMAVKQAWAEVETQFIPARRKYQTN